MSLRLKLVLALMFSGLLAVLAVGSVAYVEVRQKFASRLAMQAQQNFRSAVLAYLSSHGDWPADRDMRDFMDFLAAREALRRGIDPNLPLITRERAPPPAPGPGPGHGPVAGLPTVQGPGVPPPMAADPRREFAPPAFLFVLTDAGYRVLLGADRYREGELLPIPARALAEPIQVDGRVRAYLSSEGVLSPGPEDEFYLQVMAQSLIYGALAAALLALLLGAVLGQRLSADLRHLTAAVRAMRGGDLRQRVVVGDDGEVGSLARAFNGMSEALASRDEELRASHATITEQARQLKELSVRDPLTGLYNRRHFDESLAQLYAQSRRYGRPLTVVVADIDWFKRINDEHSHAVGDAVLCQVAELMRSHLRSSDLLARWGGEEFVLALPETPQPVAAALCEKLRQRIADFPWTDIAPALQLSMSMGLCADLQAGSAAAMLAQADAQLYRAKDGGRNRVCQA